MAQCVAVNEAGQLVAVQAQPCTSWVVLTPAEYSASFPFALSVEDGALVAGAVVSVWGAAWAFKAVMRMLRDRGDGD